MNEKIKLMSIGRKRIKKGNSGDWENTVERYAPGMYESLYCAGEKESIKKVKELHPEIVLILPSILQGNLVKGIKLTKEIKQVHPQTTVFVVCGVVDDEQEAYEAFVASGAYKCYFSPVSMDSLFHDMYVALNIE